MSGFRDKLLAGLTVAQEFADLVENFYHYPSWLDEIKEFIKDIKSGFEFVIDTTGQLDDLGHSVYQNNAFGGPDTFGRRIEAVLLIGPPFDESRISLKCYTEVNEDGDELTLKIPQGTYIAGFGDLRDFTKPFVLGGKGAVNGVGGANGVVVPFFPQIEEIFLHQSHTWGGYIASIKVEES